MLPSLIPSRVPHPRFVRVGLSPREFRFSIFGFRRRLSFLLVTFFFVFSSPAGARERHVKKFFSEIVVLPSGTIDVTENIT